MLLTTLYHPDKVTLDRRTLEAITKNTEVRSSRSNKVLIPLKLSFLIDMKLDKAIDQPNYFNNIQDYPLFLNLMNEARDLKL